MSDTKVNGALKVKLQNWAAAKPVICALYVFGSYARGEARPDSDLDIAIDVNGDDVELIENRRFWKAELTQLTGIEVKDIYRSNAAPVLRSTIVLIYRR